jgi:hypothetical protein
MERSIFGTCLKISGRRRKRRIQMMIRRANGEAGGGSK